MSTYACPDVHDLCFWRILFIGLSQDSQIHFLASSLTMVMLRRSGPSLRDDRAE